ncbi:MAG TPA: metal ABC transporter permease, partial [Gaiellaceae bacterium]|nr:metal ABC transporter permease [Gaiellaceae bacterium]
MSTAELEIQAIAVVVSVACALPGCFLVLRRLALVSDAISHSILLGQLPRVVAEPAHIAASLEELERRLGAAGHDGEHRRR